MAPGVESEILRDMWYMACSGRQLKRGQTFAKQLTGKPILLGRDADGSVFALRDICPHRGIPLSHGKFDGRQIECCYHGWRFDCTGTCTHIPSLLPSQIFDLSRILVYRYPCREVQGLVWVFIPEDERAIPDPLPEIPLLPDVDGSHLRVVESTVFSSSIDNAVIGLMDPAHGPFVHQSWFWRARKTMHHKSKQFAPSHLGFTMVRHQPSSNSKGYQWFGVESTEIRFELPSTRIEHIDCGKHTIVGLTTLTPLTETKVELNQAFYWTNPWWNLFQPLLRQFVRVFIEQDRDVFEKQQQGLNDDPQLMMINDADKPARWYHALKKEFTSSRAERRPFNNPVPEAVLQWRT